MQSYKLNYVREKKIRDKHLLVSFTGSFAVLDNEEYSKFKSRRLDEALYCKLEEKGIIVTDNNKEAIIDYYRSKKPQVLQGTSLHIIVVTLRCNEKCIYCHAASRQENASGVDMDFETARKTVDFIFQSPSSAITIEFQGGEPLLNFPIVQEIVDYANEKNKAFNKKVKFSIITNLSLMKHEYLKFLMENHIGICTSLDGPKEVHDKNRIFFGGSSHEHVEKWVHEIKKAGYDLSALLTVTKNSMPYLQEIVDEYRRLKLKKIWFRMMNNLGVAALAWNKIAPSVEEYLAFWKNGVDYIYAKDDMVENSSRIMLKKILTPEDSMFLDLMSPCGAAIGQMAYYFNGDIYSCDEARMLKDDDMFKLGNVFDDNYKGILTSNKTCSLVAASVNDTFFCNTCIYQPYCGVCPVTTYATTNSLVPKLPLDYRCKILKGQFRYLFEKIMFDEEFSENANRLVLKKD